MAPSHPALSARLLSRLLRVGAVLVLAMAPVGCVANDVPSVGALVGTYRVEDTFGTQRLALRDDGTFEQTVIDKSGRRLTASGTWEYYPDGGSQSMDPHVELAQAWVWDDFDERVHERVVDRWARADWVLWTVEDWGRPGLSWDPDDPSFIRSDN